MKQLVLTLVLALLAADSFSQPALLDLLAESVEFRLDWDAYANEEAQLTIEICPTNVCDRFTSSKPNLEAFMHFVDAYVVFASHYGDLRSVAGGRVPPISYIATRLERVAAKEIVLSACGSDLTPESISCTLRSLVADLEVAKNVVRYDQGRNVVPEPGWISADLSVANIEASFEWYASFDLPISAALSRD